MSDLFCGVEDADELLRRAGGAALVALLRRLGFWVAATDMSDDMRRFPRNLADLDETTLGNTASYWQSELSRVTAIIGALSAQKLAADAAVVKLKAQEGRRVLAESQASGMRAPSQAQMAMQVLERPEVNEAEQTALSVAAAITALEGVRGAYDGYTRTLSREISRRGDLARNALR